MYTGDLLPLQALYEQAVQTARNGRRQQAVDLFRAYLDLDNYSPQAWYWLGELLENLPERKAAFETALDYCTPGSDLHAKIQLRLDKLRLGENQTPNNPALIFGPGEDPLEEINEKIQHGLLLATLGKTNEALALLEQVAVKDPLNERAWLALSEVQPTAQEKIQALERVLEISPYSAEAHRRLECLRDVDENPLRRGSNLEARGDVAEALEVYRDITVHSRLPAERVEAHHRIEAILLRQEADQIQPVSPNLNLIRLTMGPVALFIMMVFLQTGLKPLRTPLIALVGVVSVFFGSLLVSAIEMVPSHPYWVKKFGQPGEGDEPEMRRGLRLLGLALLLAPFTIFIIEASLRLGVLRSSMFGP